jgi:spoIIIJ-associated protein
MSAAEDRDAADRLGEFLERIVADLGLDAEVEVTRDGDVLTGAIVGEHVGRFIGHHGQTIDAIRHLAQRTVLRGDGSHVRIEIDADGYRERRSHSLCTLADEAAEEALDEGRPVKLVPMPAAERRIVHEHLRDRGGIATRSEGMEPRRFIVVAPEVDTPE